MRSMIFFALSFIDYHAFAMYSCANPRHLVLLESTFNYLNLIHTNIRPFYHVDVIFHHVYARSRCDKQSFFYC